MRTSIVMLCAAIGLGGCNPSGNEPAANEAASANAAAAKAKRPAYCFFKDSETKGWSASVAANGDVTVTGKAHVKDARYRPELGPAQVEGARAVLSPTIGPNSGYASPDNWWDVTATIPASSAVQTVTVQCGAKTLAELTVRRGG